MSDVTNDIQTVDEPKPIVETRGESSIAQLEEEGDVAADYIEECR
jgi:hypothetical protein